MSDPFSTPLQTSPRRDPAPAVPAPAPAAAPAAAPVAAAASPPAAPPPAAPAAAPAAAPRALPADFAYETEHPVLPVPFTATMGEARLVGTGLSVAAAYVAIDGPLDDRWTSHRAPVRLQFAFDGFSVTLEAEVMIAGSRRPGEMTLQFLDPLGAHLPQLRHILNSHIAGDLVSLGGFLSYTGPTKPKAARAAETTSAFGRRLRSLGMAALSLALIAAALGLMISRATQTYEPRPVFIEREGRDMRATTAGQIAYLNPRAKSGEVVFTINANTGDVLNFQLPCDCEVAVTEGIFEGATVLPFDVILSIFDATLGVRVQTQISIEGLAKVMNGDRAYLDVSDGRSLPVRVETTSATTAAALRGDLAVPVRIVAEEAGALTPSDIGKSARLRLSSSWFRDLLIPTGQAS
jgi:alginate biosynthesis protein Alg44